MTPTDNTDFFNLPDAELFSAIVDSMSEAVWVIDFEKSCPYWYASKLHKKKYGIPDYPIPMDYWSTHIHPEDTVRASTCFQHALKNPEAISFEHEYRFRGAENHIYVIHDTIRFLRDEHGTVKRAVGSWTDVTQDRLKESKLEQLFYSLEEERNRFRMIAELSNAAMWEIDHATGVIKWIAGNQVMEEFGFNTPLYTIQDWLENIHEDDRQRVLLNFDRATQSERVFFDSYRFIKNNGSVAYIVDQGTFFRDDTGKAVKSIGSWVDVTRERKREIVLEQTIEQQRALNHQLHQRELKLAKAEEKLRQINEQLSANVQQLQEREFILNQSQKLAKIGSWEYDPLKKEMFWSDEMFNIYGVDHLFNISDLNEIYELFDENSGMLIKEKFQSILLNHELPFDITVQLNTPLGYKKWLRVTAYPILLNGTLQRISGLTYDITYFKESEERLRASEEKFANAFRNNPDLVTIIREEDTMIIDTNDKMEPVLGYTRAEVVGKIATEIKFFVDPNDRTKFFSEYFVNGKMEMECLWWRKDRSAIRVIISSNRLEIEGVRYILSVLRDVSDKYYAEERFRKAFDLNPDLMLIFRENDRVLVEANGKLDVFTGYTRQEALGKSFSDLHLWAIGEDKKRYYNILETQDHVTLESVFIRKGGETILGIISAQRIRLHGENHLLVIIRDVSELKQRAAELIEANKKIADLKLMALRSVMNPHFIFNALNSIQYFIVKNDRQNAINYLSTFSKLIRGVLTHSVHDKVSLADELDLLKYYINLEMVRFENKFDFKLEVSPDLDQENIEIPSLLIQPYVENAILHGLNNKQAHGLLSIVVKYDGDRVLFEVEDNGVGREESKRIQAQNFPKHKSMGTILTEERLNLINERENVSFKIEDLVDTSGYAAGTRVSIWVKF